ncbi:hypothetical protein COT47_06345 [Candidatus Woesearchaeota archaeon CG08_land_8_20_14_0_20_43_7]|nr:MAG: hypothetical protein COT47_06345 [Candidatus Woesearchaeota archaeon CG08_land_8_20_14_0_20_43_7]
MTSRGSKGLEQTLNGIFWTTRIEQVLHSLANGEDYPVHPYTIIMDIFADKPRARLIIDGKMQIRNIGIEYQNKLYDLNEKFNPVLSRESDKKTIYIPLTKSGYIKGKDKDKSLLGIAGADDDCPILFVVHRNDDEFVTWNIYYSGDRLRSCSTDVNFSDAIDITTLVKSFTTDSYRIPTPVATKGSVVIKDRFDWSEPQSIVRYLDQFVIGQDEAKKAVAVEFSNYMIRAEHKDESIRKNNIMLIGPTGVGKTYMISLLAKRSNILFIESKLTAKSTSGHVGENLESTFRYLAEKTYEKTPHGIVFFDEIDKLANDSWNSGGSEMGIGLQNELIGWLEDAEVGIGDGKTINTKNLLFIVAGAFSGLQNHQGSLASIIQERQQSVTKTIGFMAESDKEDDFIKEESQFLKGIIPDDLIAYGLIPELVGRIPVIAALHTLGVEDKAKILLEAKESPFSSIRRLFKLKGYNAIIDKEVAHVIASKCPAETGARALNNLCHKLFQEIFYKPSTFATGKKNDRINVTKRLAEELLSKD